MKVFNYTHVCHIRKLTNFPFFRRSNYISDLLCKFIYDTNTILTPSALLDRPLPVPTRPDGIDSHQYYASIVKTS